MSFWAGNRPSNLATLTTTQWFSRNPSRLNWASCLKRTNAALYTCWVNTESAHRLDTTLVSHSREPAITAVWVHLLFDGVHPIKCCSDFWRVNLHNNRLTDDKRAVLWVCNYVWSKERLDWEQSLSTALYTYTSPAAASVTERRQREFFVLLSGHITFSQKAAFGSYDYFYYKAKPANRNSPIDTYQSPAPAINLAELNNGN